jgi:hypothetical protein
VQLSVFWSAFGCKREGQKELKIPFSGDQRSRLVAAIATLKGDIDDTHAPIAHCATLIDVSDVAPATRHDGGVVIGVLRAYWLAPAVAGEQLQLAQGHYHV